MCQELQLQSYFKNMVNTFFQLQHSDADKFTIAKEFNQQLWIHLYILWNSFNYIKMCQIGSWGEKKNK